MSKTQKPVTNDYLRTVDSRPRSRLRLPLVAVAMLFVGAGCNDVTSVRGYPKYPPNYMYGDTEDWRQPPPMPDPCLTTGRCIQPGRGIIQGISDEGYRLMRSFPMGSECFRIGESMVNQLSLVRMVPTIPGANGGLWPESAVAPNSGRIRIANSVYDPVDQQLVDRPIAAIVSTAVHEFAHLALRLPQRDNSGYDPAQYWESYGSRNMI